MIDLRGENSKNVTSGYGQRTAPVEGASTNHKGLDIVLEDYNVPAVMTGTVEYVGYSSSGGNMIHIKHKDGVTARYLHLASLPSFNVGDVVKEGQIIGIMGSTGKSTGDHLHIDFQRGGATLDPDEYFDSGNGAFVSTTVESDGSGLLSGIATKIIQVLAVVLVLVFAVYLFMKAFEINII